MFSINYFENGNRLNPSSKMVDTEEEAIAIVDSLVPQGVKYLSVMAIIPKAEDNGAYNGGEWRSCGETYLKDIAYNVYIMSIKETY